MEEQPVNSQQPVVFSSMDQKDGNNNKKVKIVIILSALVFAVLLLVLVVTQLRHKKTTAPESKDYSVSSVVDSGVVSVGKDGFLPLTIRIKSGQSVTWTNADTDVHQIASDPHPTHSGIPELFSDPLNKDESFSFTFSSPGSYTYHDEMNPLGAQGTVIVE